MAFANLLKDFEFFLEKNFKNTLYTTEFQNAINYSILQGGKRLRPLLILSLWSDLKKNIVDIFPFAAAIECIHCYSLVHDDLPCMDNDDYRRNKLSSHKKFGEANALLVGDALLTETFAVIFNHSHSFSKESIFQAIKAIIFSSKMMLSGQYLDINVPIYFKTDRAKQAYLQNMEKQKTAHLFQSCFEVPAILSHSKDNKILKEIGLLLGISYQIKDDILDENTEKRRIDKKNIITHTSLFGAGEAKKILLKNKIKVEKMMASLSFQTTKVSQIINLVFKL